MTIYDYRSDDGEIPQGSHRVLQTPWSRVGLRKDHLPLTSPGLSQSTGLRESGGKVSNSMNPFSTFCAQSHTVSPGKYIERGTQSQVKVNSDSLFIFPGLNCEPPASKEDNWQGRKSRFTPHSYRELVLMFASVAKTGSWELG